MVLVLCFFSGGFLVFQQYRQLIEYGANVKLDSTFFVYTNMIGILSSIFCSLFLNVEYSDGTIRNKIIAGHSRTSIYLSNLFINIFASFLFCLSYILSNILIGIPLIGTLTISMHKTICILIGSMITIIAFCSIFTMIGMLIHSKAIAPVICIVSMFLSIFFLNEVQRILDNPKYWYDGSVNTAYVDGEKRNQLEFIYNALPAGQEMQYSRKNIENINKMCLYSIEIIVLTSATGMFLFYKKDIK